MVLATLLFVFASVSAFAQRNVKVSGTVTEGDGTPIAGVAIFQKGTQNAVISGGNGEFTISVPDNAVLQFSCIGFTDKEVAVAGQTKLEVVLYTSNEFLDDVVITAQGLTRKQKAIGYSAQKLDAEDITTTRVTDLNNALVGKIAGARFIGASAATFDTGTIVLRGTTSFSSAAGSSPIYVVDGVILGSANSLNMDDVESLNVLKGPAATALYGSRGANGAIVITTKKAQGGRSSINFSHTTTASVLYDHTKLNDLYGGGSAMDGMNATASKLGKGAYDYSSAAFLWDGQMMDDGGYYMTDYFSDENWGPRYDKNVKYAPALYFDPTSSMYQKLDTWERHLDLGDLVRTGWNNTTNVSFSRAADGISTRISFTNADVTGVLPNSKASRTYLSVNTSISPNKWLGIDLNYRYTNRYTKNGAREGYNTTGNVFYDFIQWGQTNVNIGDYKDYLRADGSWRTWNPISKDNLKARFHDNPYAVLDFYNSISRSDYNVFSSDVYAKLPFNIRLGYRFSGSVNSSLSESKRHGLGSIKFASYYSQSQSQTRDLTHQGYLTWNDTFFSDRLTAEAALFAEARAYDTRSLSSNTNNGLVAEDFYNLAGSVNTYSTSNSETHYRTRSIYGTATLGWDDTYFVDFSVRNDFDSRLAKGHNSYLYAGASASVMLSQLIDAKWLDFWKLRASLAQVGSTISAYSIYRTYSMGTKWNSVSTMYESSTQKNENIRPTISTSYEVGTEFKMFKNRFHGDINWYRKNTEDQIVNASSPAASGYSTRTLNAGLVRNQGVEFTLGGAPVRTRDFEWGVEFNISKNVNTLVELTDEQDVYSMGGNGFQYAWNVKSYVGQPVGVISTEARWARNEDGKLILRAGNATWGEVRPTYDLGTEKIIDTVQPDFMGGFSTNFRYKNLSLNASFDFSVGGKVVSWTNMWGEGSGVLASSAKINNRGVNEREAIVDGGGVYVEGVDAQGNPMSGYVDAYNYYHYKANYDNDAWIYDRSYFKMRELSVSYQLPKAWLQRNKLGISNANVSFVANNPWLIYSGIPNVDASEAGSSFLEGGQTISVRSFGLSVNVTF